MYSQPLQNVNSFLMAAMGDRPSAKRPLRRLDITLYNSKAVTTLNFTSKIHWEKPTLRRDNTTSTPPSSNSI
jgi:hypothetical protein